MLDLRRDTVTEDWTMGALLWRGAHFAWTLEDPVREQVGEQGWYWRPEFKVPARTAIPSGTYEVVVTFSNKFRRRMPLLVGVPDFAGIRFHGGRTTEHTEGCPLIGRQRDQATGTLWASEGLTADLTARIDAASIHGKVWCKVWNP